MQITPYQESLKLSKEEKDKRLIPSKVKRASLDCQVWLAKQEEIVAKLESQFQDRTQSTEISMDSIMGAHDELSLANRNLEEGKKIIAELFPTEK